MYTAPFGAWGVKAGVGAAPATPAPGIVSPAPVTHSDAGVITCVIGDEGVGLGWGRRVGAQGRGVQIVVLEG